MEEKFKRLGFDRRHFRLKYMTPRPTFTRFMNFRLVLYVCSSLLVVWSMTCTAQSPPPFWENSLGIRFLPIPGTEVKMSIWETRVKDFAAFVDATGYDATSGFYYYKNRSWRQDQHNWRDPGFEQSDDHPVSGINWRDAVAFCDWLTETERGLGSIRNNQAYRLPTENEWSLAAGVDPTPPFPFNFGNYHQELEYEYYENTSPVGFFPANDSGFFDLAGNVWEFCLDTYVSGDDYRVIRGGSWQNWHAKFIGIKARGRCSPDIRITLYGFRLVLAIEDELTLGMREAALKEQPSLPNINL